MWLGIVGGKVWERRRRRSVEEVLRELRGIEGGTVLRGGL